MNKSAFFKTGFASILMLASSYSIAGQDTYINAQLALPDVSGFSGGLGVVAAYGMPMNKLVPSVPQNINFEAEFTSTLLSKPSVSFFGSTLEANVTTFAGYGVFNHQVAPEVTFRARAGLLFESISIDTAFGSASDTDIGLSFGAGIVYKLAGNMDVIAEYTIIESDVANLSAGVQFRY